MRQGGWVLCMVLAVFCRLDRRNKDSVVAEKTCRESGTEARNRHKDSRSSNDKLQQGTEESAYLGMGLLSCLHGGDVSCSSLVGFMGDRCGDIPR